MSKIDSSIQPRILNQITFFDVSNVLFGKKIQWREFNPNSYYCSTNVFLKYYDTYNDHFTFKLIQNIDSNSASIKHITTTEETSDDWFAYASSLSVYNIEFNNFSTLEFIRVNSNIYKNIFSHILLELYYLQEDITNVTKKENKIFQYNHNLELYDLVYLNSNGLYKKGLANEEQYSVIGMISKVINQNEFTLLTFGQIETNYNFDSDSGILYLSDTEPGKFCTYEELTTNFYTPIGFYTGNTITINILDSSVGDVLKKYHDKIYKQETFTYLTESDKQDIIQEVFNNA